MNASLTLKRLESPFISVYSCCVQDFPSLTLKVQKYTHTDGTTVPLLMADGTLPMYYQVGSLHLCSLAQARQAWQLASAHHAFAGHEIQHPSIIVATRAVSKCGSHHVCCPHT